MNNKIFSVSFLVVATLFQQNIIAQKIDTTSKRVTTDIIIALPLIGSVKYRNANQIQSNNWLIGCETLDRDFANYDAYKEYINPLGIKLLRMQGGWAKTEKVKGVYDWAWLDHIIDDATSRGLQPWLQTSYGNKLYKDGGGDNLGAGMPTSKEALDAYNKWVATMVERYKSKVTNWEIWNEPNFGDNTINTAEMTADFNIRTASIIKKIQPNARISGLALGHFNYDFVDRFFKYIGSKGKMNLFDNMTYHDYVYNPDANYHEVYLIRMLLDKYGGKNIKLRQGENGAPSSGGVGRGALGDYNWTELSQAKWDTRRMLGNLGHDVECSIFGLIEMAYTNGPINRLNYKGIIQSDSTKQVIRPKIAYYAMQNVTSIFDNSLERINPLTHTHNITGASANENRFSAGTDRSVAVYGYRNKITKQQAYTIWIDETIPTNTNITKLLTLSFSNANFNTPVLIDIITGNVYEIPTSQWSKKGSTYTFKDIPVYDAPIVIADKSLIKIQ
ncbi:MAG: beta-galactosidase [Pedobacter sp.]|nr:beta-galactosidase [Chitinophagaceae bacterium]